MKKKIKIKIHIFEGLSVYWWCGSLWGRVGKQDPLLLKIMSPNKKNEYAIICLNEVYLLDW